MRTRVVLPMIVSLAVFGSVQLRAEEARLKVDVTPHVGIAPGFVRVLTRITPNEANRRLEITADSGDFYRSSFVQLDGASAPAISEMQLKNLPGGEYEIAVTLVDARGRRTTVDRRILVMSTLMSR